MKCVRAVYAQMTVFLINGFKVFCAGVGANMAYVVGQDMWLDAVTHCHTPEDVVERERVEAAGAEVLKPAIAGVCSAR